MDIENYSQNGFCVVPQLISPSTTAKLHYKIVNYSSKQANCNDIFDYPERFLRFFDPRFHKNHKFKVEATKLGLNLLMIAESYKMKEIRRTLKLNNATRIDSYLTEISNNDIIHWHCDQSFGGATDPGIYFNGNREDISTNAINKFFLHLTDVESGNGAFSYLPRSHNIGIAIRKIINSGRLKYEPFMDLKDAYPFMNKNYKLFISDKLLTDEDIDFFLANAKKALDKSHDFSLNINAGGMVIFNDLGFHQGTAPSISKRLVVRFFY